MMDTAVIDIEREEHKAREYDSITRDMAERLAKEHGMDQLARLLTERIEAYKIVSGRESETQRQHTTVINERITAGRELLAVQLAISKKVGQLGVRT